jgi:hypothetical protein
VGRQKNEPCCFVDIATVAMKNCSPDGIEEGTGRVSASGGNRPLTQPANELDTVEAMLVDTEAMTQVACENFLDHCEGEYVVRQAHVCVIRTHVDNHV